MNLPPLLFRLLLAAGVATAVAQAGPVNAAARMVNIAKASWDTAQGTRSIDSNSVVLDVEDAPPASISALRPDTSGGAPISYRPSTCQRTAGVNLGITTKGNGPPTTASMAITPTSVIHAGEVLYFKVTAPLANGDARAIDSLLVSLTTSNGDRETLTAFETDVNSGEFVGSIATNAAPPQLVIGDCALTLSVGDKISIDAKSVQGATAFATLSVDILIDPYGLVFDSEDGAPVSGVRVTLINVVTGRPATVFAPDGKTSWPSSVTTGETVVDGAGVRYPLPVGEYRFPLAAPGTYRLLVEPTAPYTAPSKVTAPQLAGLTRPDGGALTIEPASYGGTFALVTEDPVRIDVPLDRPAVAISVTKTASRNTAAPGDAVLYTIIATNTDPAHAKRGVSLVDALPPVMRLKAETIRVDGVTDKNAVKVSGDGRSVSVDIGLLAAGATRKIVYALEVRPDAPAGQAVNRALVTDARGTQNSASVAVLVTGETIASRMTIVGRIVDAPCSAKPPFPTGVAGVRVMLEDGSYSVTDRDGRYHFEGVVPGTHVVQIDDASKAEWQFVDCVRSTRSAGSATSRFVEGQGGTLAIADFHAVRTGGEPIAALVATRSDESTNASPEFRKSADAAGDRAAAGAERDWFKGGAATIAWLFPEENHNPRSPALRVALRHLPKQHVELSANGHPVDPITFDGSRDDPAKTFAVSLWRGIPLSEGLTTLTARIVNEDGTVAETLERRVNFTNTAAKAVYLADRSNLLADGVEAPVIAVRIVDREGHPVHHGMTGTFSLPEPYTVAVEGDTDQARILSGADRPAPTWRVQGDDGIALIRLTPTTTSGTLGLDFSFRDGEQVRRQHIDTWLSPGNRPWTIVGLAEGRIGAHGLGDKVEPLKDDAASVEADGRIALYAKGKILGKWLLTAAYDSAKKRSDQRLGGVIDPNTYYTVYADRTERRYDAASTRKLYLRLESRQFYALFGDFVTGFNDTEFGRYNRSGTGLKAEARVGKLSGAAFAARFETSHRRDELQGNGLTGPYQLSSRQILANSEQIRIEVRDRLRSEKILESRQLTRFIDYDVDYAAGTIRFSAPVLSRSSSLDPQFIVADYELYQAAGDQVSAGARGAWTNSSGSVRVGATAITDGDDGRTNVGAADVRVRLADTTEIRAEAAISTAAGSVSSAFKVEGEYHDRTVDGLAYVRQQDAGFGLAQQNASERGRRKVGVDGKVQLTTKLSATGSAWIDDDLTSTAERRAVRGQLQYRADGTVLRLGLSHTEDRTDAVPSATSTLIEASATHAFLNNRLAIDLASSFAIGAAQSVDFPATHRIGARYTLTPDVALIGAYEIAHGDNIDARTARIGFDVKPWSGGHLTSSFGSQDIQESGRRAFAAYGVAQSLQLSRHWAIDATLDGNRTLGGINPARVINPLQPVASGGFIGNGSLLTEDFTAITLGATYRASLWSATGRAERRFSELEDRSGVTLGLIRQLGDGQVVGAGASWTQADQKAGASTRTIDIAVSGASRPAASQVALLGKIEYREDQVTNAVAGQAGPVGGVLLTVSGDALSRRLIGSGSLAWAPYGRDENGLFQRSEFELFLGSRYSFDRIEGLDVAGFTAMVGAEARIGLGSRFEIGLTGTVRGNLADGNFGYAVGPSLGFRPATNMLISGGWNVRGFEDRDFAAARTTRDGPYITAKLKFDEHSFAFLGLNPK